MPKILNQELYNKAKVDADIKYSKPSAYKSMYIVKRYKELGGKYADDGTPKNLDRWKKEMWKDIAGLDYPVYRPTKKISSKTPLIPSEIEPTSLVEQSILKQKIKGKSNLPPFISKGGKRTAKEVKDFLDASYQKKPPAKLDGFVLDKELSTDTAKVYYNPNTNEAVVAHRGTQGALDWGNNIAYALGYYDYTSRYKQGKSVQDKAEKKYGKSNISTLGHSQGAILSRKLGADTKEVINVNPAYAFENPKKNEYNIRSKTDVVSGLYAPISYARSVLFPKYSKKHDINIPSKSTTDVLGEHSYNILDRLGNQEIGVGAENKISTNDIMKGGSLDQKIKHLVSRGIPHQAVVLLHHTGNLEPVFNASLSGKNIKPLLTKALKNMTGGSLFNLSDEDPLKEVEVVSPVDLEMEGGMRYFPVGYANVGTNPKGVKGGKVKIGKAFKKVGKSFNKAGDTLSSGLAKGATAVNPMTYVLGSKVGRQLGTSLGDITNNYLLPAVVSAGKPIYDVTAMGASTMLTGNPALGKVAGDMLWNKMVADKGYDPRERQKSKVLGDLSETAGKAVATAYGKGLMKGGTRIDDANAIREAYFAFEMDASNQAQGEALYTASVNALREILRSIYSELRDATTQARRAELQNEFDEIDQIYGDVFDEDEDVDFLEDEEIDKENVNPNKRMRGGKGRKSTKKSQEQMWNEMSRLFAHFKKTNPKSRIRSIMGFAKKIVKDKPSKKMVEFSKLFIKEFKVGKMKGGARIISDEERNAVDMLIDNKTGMYKSYLSLTDKKIKIAKKMILEVYLPNTKEGTEITPELIDKLIVRAMKDM